jgi:predicted RNA-binding Zn-ribbon protein involved in translation (DUF1610 family)
MYCTEVETLTARKPHRCTSCGEIINAGEQYLRWRSYDCGEAFTSKMHPECRAMHDDDAQHLGEGEWEYSAYSHDRPKERIKRGAA